MGFGVKEKGINFGWWSDNHGKTLKINLLMWKELEVEHY